MPSSAKTPSSAAHEDGRGLSRRVVSGISIQVLNRIVGVCRVFVLVPFFLASYGVDGYADWLTLLSAAQLIGIVALGQGDFYNYIIRTAGASRSYEALNESFASGILFFGFVTFLFLCIFFILSPWINIVEILNIRTISESEATWTLAFLSCFTIGISGRLVFSGVYTAFGEFTRGEAIVTINTMLLVVVLVVALLLGTPMWVVALLHIAITPGFNGLITFLDFSQRYAVVRPRVRWRRAQPMRERCKTVISYAVPTFVDRALEAGPTVLLGIFGIESSLIVQFNLARRALWVLDGNLIARIFAQEMTRQRMQGDRDGFRRLHRAGAVAVGLLGGGTFGGLLAFWPFFLPLWMQNQVQADMALFALLLVEQTLHTYGRHTITLLRLGGQLDVAALWASLGALVFVLAGVPALAFGSIYGMTVALIVVKAAFFYIIPPFSLQRRMPEARAFSSIVIPFMVGVVVAAPCYWVTAYTIDLATGFWR